MSRCGFLRRETASFACAFRGIADLLRGEIHARVHLAATVAALALGWWKSLSAPGWAALVLAVGMVWTAEALNTAIEHLADVAHPDKHPAVRKLKDMAAAAVLLASIAALGVGVCLFFG